MSWDRPRSDWGIPFTIIDAKGDLIVGFADNVPMRLPVGADGLFLIADAAQPLGVRWGILPTGLNYLGTWNAATNVPAIASGVGANGDYYIVGTAGNTNIDGITDWQVGDWIIFSSAAGAWQKIDNSSSPWVRNFRTIAGIGAQLITDDVIQVTAAGTLTLLAAPQTGLTISVKRLYAGAIYTINGNGKLIEGAASINLNFNGQAVELHYTGVQWILV